MTDQEPKEDLTIKRPNCCLCGAKLSTATILQAWESGQKPLCDACFYDQPDGPDPLEPF